MSYLELYNEIIFDLLNPKDANKDKGLKVRQHPKLGVYVEGQMELVVTSEQEISKRMAEGNQVRHTAATKMNARSSRYPPPVLPPVAALSSYAFQIPQCIHY